MKINDYCQKIVASAWFDFFVVTTILIAAVIVGITTYTDFYYQHFEVIQIVDSIIVWIFVIEILIRIFAEGNKPLNYFKNNWNLFDFIIVAACFLPATTNFFTVFRLARILRVLRLVTSLPKLQMLVGALVKSLSSITYISLLLSLHFYVFAAIGSLLFGENDPVHFGNLHLSVLSLFGVATLEDWTEIMYIQMYGSHIYNAGEFLIAGAIPKAAPLIAPVYFITFVLSGSMIILNLFIGVILNGMQDMEREQIVRSIKENDTVHSSDLAHLQAEVARLRLMISEFESHLDVVDNLAIDVAKQKK